MPTLVKPFRGLLPAPGRAAEVLAPPYDVLNSAEARERARGRPASFLHISKPEIDLPEGTDPYDPAVYARGAANFRHMNDSGILVRDTESRYYVYRLRMGGHEQTGIVCVGSIAGYDANRIRKHEFTRPDKENDRVRQITALNAQTGPVLLAYRSSSPVKEILARAASGMPLHDVTADDGVAHTLWRVADAATIDSLTRHFDVMDALYIADGHHRSAAASQVAAASRARNAQASGEEAYEYFLCVAFPQDEMKILDYNRVVKDLNGLGAEAFLQRVGERFSVAMSESPVRPAQTGEFGLYLARRWHRLVIRPELIPADPVKSLDVSLLQDNLLAPVLGIRDQRTDKRIDFVGGIRGVAELERRVDNGETMAAFALFPTGMDALMAVADTNQVMPPKSTWFEPKLADGLVSHVLD